MGNRDSSLNKQSQTSDFEQMLPRGEPLFEHMPSSCCLCLAVMQKNMTLSTKPEICVVLHSHESMIQPQPQTAGIKNFTKYG